MEEKESQKKDEAFLMFSKNASSSASPLTTGTAKERAQNNNKNDFGDDQTVPTSVENALVNNRKELVPQEKSKTLASEKTVGALEALYTSSAEAPVSVKTTHVLATNSGGIVSVINVTTSCGKVGQGSQKIGQADISSYSQKTGMAEPSFIDRSPSEAATGSKRRQANINHMKIIDTSKEYHAFSSDSKTTWNTSHILEAHEISKNNNIDKPLNVKDAGVNQSFGNQNKGQTSSVTQQTRNLVPHSHGEQFKVYSGGNAGASVRSSPVGHTGASARSSAGHTGASVRSSTGHTGASVRSSPVGHTGASVRSSPAGDTGTSVRSSPVGDTGTSVRSSPAGHTGASVRSSPTGHTGTSKSSSWMKTNFRSGSEGAPTGLRSFNQPLPTISQISRTVSEPKGSVMLHGTSGSTFFTKTLARNESTFQSFSLAEPVKSVTVPVLGSAVSTYSVPFSQTPRTGIDVPAAAADLSRQASASFINQSSVAISNYKAPFSSHSETQIEMEINHMKSAVPYTMHYTADGAPEHIKTISAKVGDIRASITSLVQSSGLCENKLSPSSTSLPLHTRQKPLFLANEVELTQILQPPAAHLSAANDQIVAAHRQSCGSHDKQAATSWFSGERREAATKLNAQSRSPKPQFNTTAQFTADDEDDDNDFIPVGMLQLSALKRAEDTDTAAKNSECHSAEKNAGSVYQLNQGLNVIYKQQMQLNRDPAQCAEKAGIAEVSGIVQEKLKQKGQKHKLKQLASAGQEQSLQLQGMAAQLQAMAAQKQQEQGYDAHRHQLLVQLVQHAQQQQKQLQGQQQKQLQGQQQLEGQKQLQDQKQPQQQQKQLQDQQKKQLQDQQKKQLQDQQKKQLQDQQKKQLQDQQKKQLQDLKQLQHQQRQQQDQHNLHQSQSTLSPVSSGQCKSPEFLKNQGLIIHHCQAEDAKLILGVQNLSQQNMFRGQEIKSEQSEDQHCLQEHSTQQFAEVNFKNSEESVNMEKSHKQQQRDQRYSHQLPTTACSAEPPSGQLQQQTAAMQQESPWQGQSSNIPKIAEWLLQQTLNEQMLQQVRPDQMVSHSKSEQLAQSLSHNVSAPSSDSRPITPASAHHAMPSVNQQHPEIARMLSSPVSPRQPGSPRQAVSPRCPASPIQSSATSSQFSHQHLTSPSSRQSVGLHQSSNYKIASCMSSSSYQSTGLKQAVSFQQGSNSRQLPNSAQSSTNIEQMPSTGHEPQSNGQTAPMQFPASQRKLEQARIDLNQSLATHPEIPLHSQNEQQQSEGVSPQFAADRQHVAADISITLPNSDAHQLSPLQSISFSQTVQSFSPGQIIHYRPPENKNAQSKVLTAQKSQSSLLVQFPPPAVSLTKSPMPLIQTASSAWCPVPSHLDSEMTTQLATTTCSYSSEPVNIQRPNRKMLQMSQPHDRKQLMESSVESQVQHLNQAQVSDKLSLSLSENSKSQSYQQDTYDEVQLKPPSTSFVQPASGHTDIKSAGSYMSGQGSAHNRHFQTIADLIEKEASFLQSLFAGEPSQEIDEIIQRNSNQEPHSVSQMQASYSCPLEEPKRSDDSLKIHTTSEEIDEIIQRNSNQELHSVSQIQASYSCPFEEPKRSDDSLKIHTTSAPLYPEMRKNEGGLKVLSEIASKRYALDVAGKEDEGEHQAFSTGPEDTSQKAQKGSHGIPEDANQSEQASVDKIPALSSLKVTVSNTARQKKTGDTPEETKQSFETKGEYSDMEAKSMDREAKDTSVTHGETPRREVRQRKPKKPFEQEEAPVKRLSKVSPPKNIPGKKQAQGASAQNLSHKRGHSLREKTAEVKAKEEIEKEDNKVFVRQTRSTVENRIAENEKRDPVVVDSEDIKQEEFDSSSRRLSRRLREKEKELLQQKKAEENEIRVSTRQQPARINNKEEASDESTSTTATRSSRRVSISSSDDNLVPETSERIVTRSKNRSVDDKVVTSGGKVLVSHKQSSQIPPEQKKATNNPKTSTPNAIVTSSKETRRETRNTSKSPSHDSQPQSPARLSKPAPVTLTRMATRHTVVEMENSGVGGKNKRLLPSTPAEELLHWQKRMKKLDLPSVVLESFKLPDEKPEVVKEQMPKDDAKGKEVALKGVAKPETEIVKVKHSKKKKKKKEKGRRRRNRQKLPQPTAKEGLKRSEDDKSESYMEVVGNEENSQEKGLISNLEQVEHELRSKDHKLAGVEGERSPRKIAEQSTEKDACSPKSEDHEEATTDEAQQEATKDEINIDAGKGDLSNPETEEQTNRTPEEVLQTVEATPEPIVAEPQSVIKCTSAFVHPATKVQESPHSIVSSAASAEASPLLNERSISLTALAGERRNMQRFKLVPVLEEDASHMEECLIPFSGFLVSDGNSDHILIPRDLIHKPVVSTIASSASVGFCTSSLSSSSVGLSSTFVTPALPELSQSAVLSSSKVHGQPLAPEVVSTSGLTFESVPTVYSPMKYGHRTAIDSTPAPMAWTSPSPISSVPTISHLSAWTQQWPSYPSQNTPSSSAGEPSPVVAAAKSRASPAVTDLSQSHYTPTRSWDTTPSSPLSPFPTSTSAWDPSSAAPLPAPTHQQQESSWTASSHQSSQEPPWSSSPSVTEATLESWSKEYFPGATYTSSRSATQLQHTDSSQQTVLPSPGYSIEAGSSQQSQMYASNSNHTPSSGAPYSSSGTAQDAEFVDSRHDSLIQSYLRQVASNPGGFSQELAGFNLGQQELAYLENRLRQSLSPNTLFSAVAAYEDASGQGTTVGHDSSLQESINLVHTVNLDMEEGHLDSPSNLDLSDLRSNLTSSLGMSRNVDGQRSSQVKREETLSDHGSGGDARDMNNSTQQDDAAPQDGLAASGVQKNDVKKTPRERKSQYEVIVIKDDEKRYKCLLCSRNFGLHTIYRHLRTHDADYKISCSLCDKQYTQKSSLTAHWLKAHGDHALSPDLMKSPTSKELSGSEPLQLSHEIPPGPRLNSPDGAQLKTSGALIRSPDTHIKSPSDPKRRRRTSSTSNHVAAVYDFAGVAKQEAAHKQVEELRRLKAEKKLAAARRKTESHSSDDGMMGGDSLLPSTSQSVRFTDEDQIDKMDTKNMSDFANHHTEQAAVAFEQNISQKMSFPGPPVTSDSLSVISRMSTNPNEDFANLAAMKPQNVIDNQFHFNSPHTFMPTVPQFHADNIPKPISTPVVKSNRSTELSCSKEVMSAEVKALNADGKYPCELCSTVLNTKNSYTLHMRRHNNVKAKFCKYCNKDFHTAQELRSHERTHTGERPYKCEICHTMFAHSGSHVSHRKSHEKRGELEPFPIVDGKIEYPKTFKKPRLSGGIQGGSEKTKKKKDTVSKLETMQSEQPSRSPAQGDQLMGVIQRNHLESLHEPTGSAQEEFHTDMPGRWQNLGQKNLGQQNLGPQNLGQQRLASEHFRPNMGSPGGGDRNMNSDTLRVVATPQSMLPPEQGNQGFVPPDEDYTSASGNVSTDYYSSAVGYNQNMVQPEFLSPHADTSSSHGFYKQDKYTPRASSVNAYSTDSQNQATSLAANVAVEKSLQYTSSHSFSNSGQGSRAYYSPQQHSSEYPYAVSCQNEDYQPEEYDDTLVQYKNDSSSSEIVKKLLQHYNVPASPFQDAVPIDYSHQIQEESEYNQSGHGAGSDYGGMGVGRSTPAPPSYSATIGSQQKLYYNSQSSSSGYGSSMLRQQSLITQDQGGLNLHDSRQQLLQSLVNDGQFGSPYSQGHNQDMYSSDDRHSSSHSNQSTRFASPSLP